MNQQNIINAIKNVPCFIGLDLDKRIIIFNNTAEKLTGHLKKDVVGKKCCDIIKTSGCNNDCLFEKSLNENRTISRLDVFIKCGYKSIPLNITIAPAKNENGMVTGVLKTLFDKSEMISLD